MKAGAAQIIGVTILTAAWKGRNTARLRRMALWPAFRGGMKMLTMSAQEERPIARQ